LGRSDKTGATDHSVSVRRSVHPTSGVNAMNF
jgi:hypothetical protein